MVVVAGKWTESGRGGRKSGCDGRGGRRPFYDGRGRPLLGGRGGRQQPERWSSFGGRGITEVVVVKMASGGSPVVGSFKKVVAVRGIEPATYPSALTTGLFLLHEHAGVYTCYTSCTAQQGTFP